MEHIISKSKFKPQMLKYFRKIEKTGQEVIITDHENHHPSFIIKDCQVNGMIYILFGIIIIGILDGRNHLGTINIKKTMINLMILIQFYKRSIRKNSVENTMEGIPFSGTPEIVDKEESTS